ncbi:MAG: hypothetical protein Q9166_005881 [cf. Caloplaca sp. 2 TL-2023]
MPRTQSTIATRRSAHHRLSYTPHLAVSSTTHHPAPYHHLPSSSQTNENPPIPLTRPLTTIRLPPATVSAYQRLLSLPPSSPLLHTTLSNFPPSLLKKPYRHNSFIPSFLYSTPIFKFFLERSRAKLSPSECCSLCPLHERLLEAPLVHLMGLVAYEMYTHLQSLMGMHPVQRSSTTNEVLAKLHPWQECGFFEPGTVVEGCLACELGRLYQDLPAMEALAVCAKSGRRSQGGKVGVVQLVDEGWLGWWGDGGRGVKEVRADRRKARSRGDNAVWRGWGGGGKKGELEWKEKRGFVLSPSIGPSQMEQAKEVGRFSPSQRSSRMETPVRPDRPKGLTLSMVMKRKPVSIAGSVNKEEEKNRLSTATTVVGSPPAPRPSVRNPHENAGAASSLSSRVTHGQPAGRQLRVPNDARPTPTSARSRSQSVRSNTQTPHRNQLANTQSRVPTSLRPPPPASSIYSRTQGLHPTAQNNKTQQAQSTVKPRIPIHSNLQEQLHPRIPSTQQTRWTDFKFSNTSRMTGRHASEILSHHTAPRRSSAIHNIGARVAAGEYEWWDDSDSEDEKVVVPSASLANIRHEGANIEGPGEGGDSASDYEGDESEEEIHQRYLDEHEELLRVAQGVQDGRPRTRDYLNTLPERPVENLIGGGSKMGPGHSTRTGGTMRRERSVRR